MMAIPDRRRAMRLDRTALAPLALAAALLLGGGGLLPLTHTHADDSAQADGRLFSETGYRVDRDTFWDYFQQRGGAATFGFPVSRDFLFLGCQVQFFQRTILQQCQDQGVGTLNLLDEGLLPYTRINGSTFPAADAAMRQATPAVASATYSSDILNFVAANAPDTFDGEPVNFGKSFLDTVGADATNTNDSGARALLALEVWGAPTSKPAHDPNNHDFIYQRYQRGIMHYDRSCSCTRGLLLADYLKAVITGKLVPEDLAAQASGSPLLRSAAGGTLPIATMYGDAFTPPGAGGAAAPIPIPTATPSPTPAASAVPTAVAGALPPIRVPSPDYGLSMFLWGQPATTRRDLEAATGAGFRWQKTLFQWRQIEGAGKGRFDWSEADRVVAASSAAGVKVIARLDLQPDWARAGAATNGPPDNYADYADFVRAFVSRYKPGSAIGTVDAIEVWNEVNLTREWGNGPISAQQAGDYVRLLSGAYQAAHAASPGIIVVTAGLSPTGTHTSDAWDDAEYLQWLYAAGLRGGVNYDALGAHGNTQAPEVDAAVNSLPAFPHPSFYFRRIEQLRDIMVNNGDADRQVWLLEFGWTADQVHPAYSWFAVTEEKKAANVVKAFQYAHQNWTPWIGVMTLWTLSDPTWTADREEYWWAVVNPDGTPRPAWTALKAARAAGQL